MPKPLPPATIEALNPPPGPAFPYTFFENVAQHPFRPLDATLNLRNAWWLMDAAFASYSAPGDVVGIYNRAGLAATVQNRHRQPPDPVLPQEDSWSN